MHIFHVHSYRCAHAENVPDEAYVKKAIGLGASDIWFTDHAPFPGDPFGWRMVYSDLEEYLSTLSKLKRQYSNIRIHIGLETEYFPHFDKMGYYRELCALPDLEMLLLGQHMAEVPGDPLRYSFSESEEFLDKNEFKLLGNAIVQGAKTGYFDVIAHPDRIFRRCSAWNTETEKMAADIIQTATAMQIPLEMNLASVENPDLYKPQFWRLVPEDAKRVVGYDAHSLDELEIRHMEIGERSERFA